MDTKQALHRYLRRQREDLAAKAEGVSEYDRHVGAGVPADD